VTFCCRAMSALIKNVFSMVQEYCREFHLKREIRVQSRSFCKVLGLSPELDSMAVIYDISGPLVVYDVSLNPRVLWKYKDPSLSFFEEYVEFHGSNVVVHNFRLVVVLDRNTGQVLQKTVPSETTIWRNSRLFSHGQCAFLEPSNVLEIYGFREGFEVLSVPLASVIGPPKMVVVDLENDMLFIQDHNDQVFKYLFPLKQWQFCTCTSGRLMAVDLCAPPQCFFQIASKGIYLGDSEFFPFQTKSLEFPVCALAQSVASGFVFLELVSEHRTLDFVVLDYKTRNVMFRYALVSYVGFRMHKKNACLVLSNQVLAFGIS